MASIDYFLHPTHIKVHPLFNPTTKLRFLTKAAQLFQRTTVSHMSISSAVKLKIVKSKAMGNFLVRAHEFLLKMGANTEKLRFRQHLANESPHHHVCESPHRHVRESWVAELVTSDGPIPCATFIDQDVYAYDTSGGSGPEGDARPLMVVQEYTASYWADFEGKEGPVGNAVGPDSSHVQRDVTKKEMGSAVESLGQGYLRDWAAQVAEQSAMATPIEPAPRRKYPISREIEKSTYPEYIPSVIRSVLDVTRTLRCILEHVHWHRPEDPANQVLVPLLTVAARFLTCN